MENKEAIEKDRKKQAEEKAKRANAFSTYLKQLLFKRSTKLQFMGVKNSKKVESGSIKPDLATINIINEELKLTKEEYKKLLTLRNSMR